LVELETLGVVEFAHNRGARVGPFGPRELREVFHLRRILETEATRSACGRIEREPLERLQALTQHLAGDCAGAERLRKAMDADLQLHELIASRCGNLRLAKEIRRYRILVETVYQIVGGEEAIQQDAMREHLAILDALFRIDPNESAAAMARHVDSTACRTEMAMFGENDFDLPRRVNRSAPRLA
jgi:DNA-binding GntR family transcriptional regulator